MIIPETTDHTIEHYKNARENTISHVVVKSRYTIINADKPEENFVAEWGGEALDSSDKATNKAMTASEKYFLMKLFKISDREDADSESISTPSNTDSVAGDVKVISSSPVGSPPSSKQMFKLRQQMMQLNFDEKTRDGLLAQLSTSRQASHMIGELQGRIEKQTGTA